MREAVDSVAFFLSALVVGAGVLLFLLKFVRSRRRDRDLRLRQRYVDLVGELIVGGRFEHRVFRSRAGDPLFRGVILEYLRLMDGRDRDQLLAAARDMGIVDRYLADLRSTDKETRVEAAQALAEVADPTTIEELVFALHDPVPEVRAQASAALANIGDPRAVKSMLAAMDDQDEWNAQRMADSLFAFGAHAVPEMMRYLQGSGRYRPLIARTLGLIGDLRAEPALLQALTSPSFELRVQAVAALGRAGSIDAVPYLIEALADERWEVRAQAATALGRRRDREALPALRRSLADSSWWVRHNAAAAVAELPGGFDTLRRALDHPDPYARDAAASVLLSSGAASEAIRKADSEDPLERAASEDLIAALAEAGKSEYFVSAGLDAHQVETMRIRRQLLEGGSDVAPRH